MNQLTFLLHLIRCNVDSKGRSLHSDGNCFCCPFSEKKDYCRTSRQPPPWRQKKIVVVERWRLWGGRGVIWHPCFFQALSVVCSRLLYHAKKAIKCTFVHGPKAKCQENKMIEVHNARCMYWSILQHKTATIYQCDNEIYNKTSCSRGKCW